MENGKVWGMEEAVGNDQQRIDFTKRLQKIMMVRRVAPKDLIDGVSAHKSQVSKWVTGRITPSRNTIQKLADFFGCNVEWLSSGKGPMVASRHRLKSIPVPETNEADVPPRDLVERLLHSEQITAKLNVNFFAELQTWLHTEEKINPGFGSWFRLEFQNRFPEFTKWRAVAKKKDLV
jgi:hypothetical protein